MDFNFNTPCTISATGSREICNPPPTDTDQDYLIYVAPDDIDKLLAEGNRPRTSGAGTAHLMNIQPTAQDNTQSGKHSQNK